MNTSDIRDMESNQRLFWSVAVPVTVLVLTAAFIYGYKADEVMELLGRLPHPRPRVQKKEAAVPVTIGPKRQATWLTIDSKEFVREGAEEKRAKGRLGKYFRRRRKSNRIHEEGVGV